MRCGQVERPLDPARPEGRRIAVHVVVVPALARRRLDDPVFLLAGGPGQSAIALLPNVMPLFGRLHNRRDIVFVDQRGTGRSSPLECADARREPLSDASDPDLQVAALARCRARLAALPQLGGTEGLRFFTTPIASQDLDAVRRRLGYARINLVGASYGTRVALDYQRQFPDAVRRGVLDGVVPPDMALPASASADAQAALDALFASCDAEPACRRAHPLLRARWDALVRRLPLDTSVPDPLTGVPEPLRVTHEVLLGAVRGPLYAPSIAAALPAAIDAAADGRFTPLVGLSSLLAPRSSSRLAMGMHFAVVCAEDLPPATDLGSASPSSPAWTASAAATGNAPAPSAGRDFGAGLERLYARACTGWPRGDVPAAFRTVPRSRSALLLLSGGLDPAAPPRHAERTVAALGPLARHVVVAQAGHGILGLGCVRDVVFRFLDAASDAEALAVDATCATRLPRPPAFEPIGAASSPSGPASAPSTPRPTRPASDLPRAGSGRSS